MAAGHYKQRGNGQGSICIVKDKDGKPRDCPYDLEKKDYTLKDVYDAWSKEYFKLLKGVSSERTVTSAFSYMHELYNKRMRDIRV